MQVNFADGREAKPQVPKIDEGNRIFLYQDRIANTSRRFKLTDVIFERRSRFVK